MPALPLAVEATVAVIQERPTYVSALLVRSPLSEPAGAAEWPADRVTRGDSHYEAKSAVGETRLYIQLDFALVSLSRRSAFRVELARLACDALRSQPAEAASWSGCPRITRFIERPEHLDPVDRDELSPGVFDFVPANLGPHHASFTMMNTAGREVTVLLNLMVQFLPMPAAAFSAPKPNWIGDVEPDFMDAFALAVRGGPSFVDATYSERPPKDLPTLTMRLHVPYFGNGQRVAPSYIEFAAIACADMDIRQHLIGAWGPECHVEAIRHAPSGRLMPAAVPHARPGSFTYAPRRLGLDHFSFVLTNGAGRRILVVAELRAYRHTTEP